jgi:hypothetical protein
MCSSFSSRGWIALAATLLCLSGCSKPQPNAPTQDFARRHQCPVKSVRSETEGSDRMRVTGCGESEVYLRTCGNRGAVAPRSEARAPISESEARYSSAHPPSAQTGCAWSRKQSAPAPSGGAPQPKWLSDP